MIGLVPHGGDTYLVDQNGNRVNPAKEDGNLANLPGIKTGTDRLDVLLSTIASLAKQTDGSQKSQIVDPSGNAATTTLVAGKRPLDVNVLAGVNVTMNNQASTDAVQGLVYTSTNSLKLSSSSTEYPLLYFVIPGAPNTKSNYLLNLSFDINTKGNLAVFRLYLNPTVNVGNEGASVSRNNTFSGGGFGAASTLVYSGTVAASLGSLLNQWSVGVSQNSLIIPVNYTRIFAPGQKFIITAQGSGPNTSVNAMADFAEKVAS